MVTTKDEEVFGVHYFVANEETDRFEGLLAAVDIITQKEIVAFWGEASVFE